MKIYRGTALLAGLLVAALFANAASRSNTIQIKVLDSETRSLGTNDNGVPVNCEQLTFDAYCRSSRTAPLMNTLLVQEGNNRPYRIACTAESSASRCTPLPRGESFEARREKNGVLVYYVDERGKLRSQLYKPVAGDEKPGAAATMVAPSDSGTATGVPAEPQAPTQSPARGSAVSDVQTPTGAGASVSASNLPATVKCSFSSSPAGAEVTLDGRYVGSTPSVLGVATGTHVVLISMPGFAPWKRDLAISSGAELSVNAVLQKVP